MSQNIYDPAFVADVFDRCAKSYRNWSAISSFGFVERWRKACIVALPRSSDPEPVVVDLMAGTGEIWAHLLARHPNISRIVAIDISHQMHLHALERLHKSRAERIQHIETDVLTNELPDGLADCVISSFGLKTFDHAQQAVLAGQIARILKSGGTFSFIEASDPKGWIFRPAYRFYLDRILPSVERLFLHGAQDFSMIGIYTRAFGDCSHMHDCLSREGLEVTVHRHFFGCATGLTGRKP